MMKIVVLAGGLSPERNVSLTSGAKVCQALRQRGHRAALVDMYFGIQDTGVERPEQLFDAPIPEKYARVGAQAPDLAQVKAARRGDSISQFGPGVLELCAMADCVFLALHGTCGEDGRVQAAFDLLGIPYTGAGYLGNAIALDKDLTKRLVAAHPDVHTPAWETVDCAREDLDAIVSRTALPVVVKPLASGSSIGVHIAHTEQQLRHALEQSRQLGGRTVLEQFVQGREFSVAVLEGKALPAIEIIPKQGFYDYENKYQAGAAEEVCPADIPEEWERRMAAGAQAVFRTLELSVYSRADFIITPDGTPYFLEINTLPGITPTSLVPQEAAAAGIEYGQLCERIIMASLQAREKGVQTWNN